MEQVVIPIAIGTLLGTSISTVLLLIAFKWSLKKSFIEQVEECEAILAEGSPKIIRKGKERRKPKAHDDASAARAEAEELRKAERH